jgi:surface antigen Omp85-like protein
MVDRFATTAGDKHGWYLELSNMITGSGWISLGPGYREHVLHDKAFLDVSGAASWHFYKMVQGRFEAPDLTKHHITLGTQTMWQDNTQVHYFGVGPESLEANESMYRMRTTDVVGYGYIHPVSALAIGGEFGWLQSPKLSTPAGTFKPDKPATTDVFPADPGVTPIDQPDYLHNELSATVDTRDYPGHPTGGGMYRAAMTGYHDRRDDIFSFRQYQAEAAHFVPVTGPKWILALHGWFVSSDVSDGHDVPIYLLPSLGGANTLRSYSTYRFHDRSSLLLNAESRWTVAHRVDVAVFADAGNVAHDAGDLNLDKTSIGAGVRLFTRHTTFARLDVSHGSEGWHVVLRTNDPFRFSRLKRRVADLPFVP